MGSIGGTEDRVLVDLHLHSRASGTATNWWVKGLGADVEARESYTPPEEAYRMAKGAGMDFVTLTDHETIDGALTLTHHPDFFAGEEVSAYLPEEGGYVDVLVYGLDGEAHREAQARRGDAHELVAYLREAGVVHVLAHPIYAMPGPLDRGAVEKRLVMFGLWEFINGSRPAQQNRLAREIAGSVGPVELRQMALRHGLPTPPHRGISGTGGSDDHGGIYGGATHTVLPKVESAKELLDALAASETRPAGEDGSVAKMIHTGFRLAGAAIGEGEDGRALRVLRGLTFRPAFLRRSRAAWAGPDRELSRHVPFLARLGEDRIRATLAGRYEDRLSKSLGNVDSGFPALDFLSSIGSFIDGHVFIAPYVGVHGYFGREKKKTRDLRRELRPGEAESLKVGVFVDGMDGIHGVATMYRNVQALAGEERAEVFRIVRCDAGEAEGVGETPPAKNGVHSLRQVATFPVPLYDGLVLGVPSLLDVLEHVAEEDYDVLHVATPGPLGLAALVAGVVLSVPVTGAYHTEFGAYAEALSGDTFVAEIVDVAVREFYERCMAVAVPSQATALALRNRGYRIRRFEVLKNGVDNELFDPAKRDPALHDSMGGGRTLLLYVGRVSREKGLDRLAAGYLALRRRRDDVHLVIAGDGPYRGELEAMLGTSATFTGFLRGEELARVYASCDLFVFPSTTDTLGRAMAEAQASGLPAVVCGMGGPRECISPDVSGFVVDPGDEEAFFSRIELLTEDPGLRERMGQAAREFAAGMSWEAVLDSLIELHSRLVGPRPSPNVYSRP
jgi:glycosyltransferase involved in cell wall biosynthesis